MAIRKFCPIAHSNKKSSKSSATAGKRFFLFCFYCCRLRTLKLKILIKFFKSRYDTAYLGDIFRILVPDVLLLIASLVSLNLGKRLQKIYVAARRELIYNVAGGRAEDASAAIEARRTSVTATGVPAAAATTFTDHFCPLGNVQDESADNGVGGSGGDGDDKQQHAPSLNHHKLSTSTAMASTTYLNRIHHQHNQHASKGPMTAIRRVITPSNLFSIFIINRFIIVGVSCRS